MDRLLPGGSTWNAPSGGHIMWTRSRDDGATWTRPRDLAVLPNAYVPGAIAQMSDGTMYMATLIQRSHFYAGRISSDPLEFLRLMHQHFPEALAVFCSRDNGESWREVGRTSGPFLTRLQHPCSPTEAKDGSLLMLVDGHAAAAATPTRWVNALLRSTDGGATWHTRSIFGHSAYDMEEGHLAYMPDGRLATASRPWGLWTSSADEGLTWSDPKPLLDLSQTSAERPHPSAVKKGDLLVTSDGAAVLLTCGGPGGNGQVLYSRDSGDTWVKPAPDRGFQADRFAYYPSACALPDDSIFMVGDHQGFPNQHGPFGAEVVATRFRILSKEEGEGIETLPIAGELHEPWATEKDAAEQADKKMAR